MPSQFEIGGAARVRKAMATYVRRSEETRLGLQLMPPTNQDATQIIYERDALLRGVQAARGLDGATQPAKLPGFDQFASDPAYYGDHIRLSEKDLVERRQAGDWMAFDNQGTLTGKAAEYLERRQGDRMEKNVFDLLVNGSYDGQDAQGRSKYFDIYAIQRYTPGTLFSNLSGSSPLTFLRDTIATAELGVSVDFRGGEMLMNRVTLNLILSNTNANDLGGKRFDIGQTLNSVEELNDILLANDLPKVRLYNEGFYPDTGGFQRFIPNGRIIILGKRTDGEPIGEYWLTRAAQNGGRPGWWTDVVDNTSGALADPPHVLVKAGHNGGPKLWYPEAALSLTVAA